jgi:molecular chaperone GrpE
MIEDENIEMPAGEDLREETAERAPEVAEHDRTAEVEEALAKAKQDVLYAHAELQNVRRRAEKEVADARAYGVTSFARDILSVADNLERGLAAIPEEVRSDERLKGLIAGLDATNRELNAVFQRQGITRIAAMGLPLDPNRHQAMLEVPSAEAEPGTIVQEMQSGYMIKDRLLRPALVGVAKKPE